MPNDAFKDLPIQPPAVPVVADKARLAAATLRGAGFATGAQLSVYLGVGTRNIVEILARNGITANRAGLFSWQDVWTGLWKIGTVPPDAFERMKAPLLSNADVAALIGVCHKSIRRDGDRPVSQYDLPPHVDLSDRIRRHHPLRIHAWTYRIDMAPWLRPVARRPRGPLGLRQRMAKLPAQGAAT